MVTSKCVLLACVRCELVRLEGKKRKEKKKKLQELWSGMDGMREKRQQEEVELELDWDRDHWDRRRTGSRAMRMERRASRPWRRRRTGGSRGEGGR